MVETSWWEIHDSFSKGVDKQKSNGSAEYVTGHVYKSDKYACVFTYVHMMCSSYMSVCIHIYVLNSHVYVHVCVCGRQEGILAIMKHLTHNFQ